MSKDLDEYAFPQGEHGARLGGMTLRDHFAGQELSKMRAVDCEDTPEAYERLAQHCYRMADAMLKERAK